jgi:hypothetical protein
MIPLPSPRPEQFCSKNSKTTSLGSLAKIFYDGALGGKLSKNSFIIVSFT